MSAAHHQHAFLIWSPGGIRLQPKDPTMASRLPHSALAAPNCTFSACGRPPPSDLEKYLSFIQHSNVQPLNLVSEFCFGHACCIPRTPHHMLTVWCIHGHHRCPLCFLCSASPRSYSARAPSQEKCLIQFISI